MCGPVYILQCPNIYLMNLTSFLLPRFWVSSLLIGSHSSFSVKCWDYKVKRLAGKKKGTRGSPQPVCITVYDTEFEAVFSRKTISAPNWDSGWQIKLPNIRFLLLYYCCTNYTEPWYCSRFISWAMQLLVSTNFCLEQDNESLVTKG